MPALSDKSGSLIGRTRLTRVEPAIEGHIVVRREVGVNARLSICASAALPTSCPQVALLPARSGPVEAPAPAGMSAAGVPALPSRHTRGLSMVIPMTRECVPPPALLSNAGCGMPRRIRGRSLEAPASGPTLRLSGLRLNWRTRGRPFISRAQLTHIRAGSPKPNPVPQNAIFPPNWNCRAVPTIVVIWPALATGPDRVEHRRRRQAEVDVVGDVEAFGAQLQPPRPAEARRS